IGYNGSQSRLTRYSAVARSMAATRRVASPSLGVIPFQMPQIFSQLSQPTPLKNANCRLLVLLRFQRSEILTIFRVSSHLYLSTSGVNGYWYCPQVITFQASASSEGPPSGSKASGRPALSAAREKASGTPSWVSPLTPSAPTSFISSASSSGQDL